MIDAPDAPELDDAPETPEEGAPDAAPPEPPEASPEAGAEDSAPKVEGEPKKDQPPSLKAAIRIERKAKALRAEAEAKVADVSRREAALRADVERWQGQVKEWEARVQPRLQRLQRIEQAVQAGDHVALFEVLGVDPKRALDGFAADLQLPDAVREELAQARRERAERQQREAEERRQQEEHQRSFAERQQLWDRVRDVVDAAPDRFAMATRYALEVGPDTFVGEAQKIRAQLGPNVTTAALLKEIERRASVYYGDAAPASATPSQGKGPGQPGNPAAPNAKPASKKPVGVPQRAAAEASVDVSEDLTPEELDRRAAEHLRRVRRAG